MGGRPRKTVEGPSKSREEKTAKIVFSILKGVLKLYPPGFSLFFFGGVKGLFFVWGNF